MSPEDFVESGWGVVEQGMAVVLAPGLCDGGEVLDFEGGVAVVEVAEDDVQGVEVRVKMVVIHGIHGMRGVEAVMLA